MHSSPSCTAVHWAQRSRAWQGLSCATGHLSEATQPGLSTAFGVQDEDLYWGQHFSLCAGTRRFSILISPVLAGQGMSSGAVRNQPRWRRCKNRWSSNPPHVAPLPCPWVPWVFKVEGVCGVAPHSSSSSRYVVEAMLQHASSTPSTHPSMATRYQVILLGQACPCTVVL